MRRLIINADDFGSGQRVNGEVIKLMSSGCITSASILANGAKVEEAVEFASSNSSLSFGIHVNLSEGKCSGSTTEAPGIIEGGHFLSRPPLHRVHPQENQIIFDEWSAQIDRLLHLGLQPSHIDSHHHVHTIPKYFRILKRIQTTYGIRRIRLSKNVYASERNLRERFAKFIWNSALRRTPPFARTTDFFTSVDDYHALGPSRLGPGTYELMCHPGHPDYEAETARLIEHEPLSGEESLISYHSL
jgi:predicted glycoside hydrolase/deacetylase ChbG (UPF0249 family)